MQNTPEVGLRRAEDPVSPPVAEPQTQLLPPAPDPLQAALELLSSGQEAQGIAGLRHELAEGERSLEAGFALASYLASRERQAEALAAIEVARTSHPQHAELALARAELLRDLSPIHKVDRVVAPTLVLHGANDTNVPVVEAEQVVDNLKERGVPVEYILFPDEGHGFRKAPNRIRTTVAIVRWFEEHLKDPS